MIGFAGLSHLGIVSSIAAAAKGFDVLAYDPDSAKTAALTAGDLPLFEPGLDDALARSRPHVRFTSDVRELRECDVTYLSLDVPTDTDDRSNVAVIEAWLTEIAANSAPGTVLVLLSQVPPGFTRRWAARLQSTCRDLVFYYQAETLIFGRALERALQPERILVGCEDPNLCVPAAYAELLNAFGCPLFYMRYESAELAKLAINMYLASSVSVTNTLAGLCERLGADWAEIVPALRLDARIGPKAYLTPGLGLSGGNLERDLATVRALAGEHGAEVGVVDAWLGNSRHRRAWVLRLLHSQVLSRRADATIALWGLAYKANTTSVKNAPALELIEALAEVPVRAYDPKAVLDAAERPNVYQVSTALDACRDADVLAVLTPWQEFADIDPLAVRKLMRGRTVLDPFGALDGSGFRRAGFDYFRLGEPAAKEVLA